MAVTAHDDLRCLTFRLTLHINFFLIDSLFKQNKVDNKYSLKFGAESA